MLDCAKAETLLVAFDQKGHGLRPDHMDSLGVQQVVQEVGQVRSCLEEALHQLGAQSAMLELPLLLLLGVLFLKCGFDDSGHVLPSLCGSLANTHRRLLIHYGRADAEGLAAWATTESGSLTITWRPESRCLGLGMERRTSWVSLPSSATGDL